MFLKTVSTVLRTPIPKLSSTYTGAPGVRSGVMCVAISLHMLLIYIVFYMSLTEPMVLKFKYNTCIKYVCIITRYILYMIFYLFITKLLEKHFIYVFLLNV